MKMKKREIILPSPPSSLSSVANSSRSRRERAFLHIPNTTSEKAQAFLWQMPDPNLLLPLPAPNEIAQWKAVSKRPKPKTLRPRRD